MKNIILFAIILLMASCQKCEEQPLPAVKGPSVGLTLDGVRIIMFPWKVDSMLNGRVDYYYKDAEAQLTLLCTFKDNTLYVEPNGFYKDQSFIILHEAKPIRLELCGSNITHNDIDLSFVW